MKKVSKLLLVALFLGTIVPVWGQSSTEGKEFWVGLTMAIRPPGGSDSDGGQATPYLAISTKEKTVVTIASPAFPSDAISETIDPFKWQIIEIPKKWWYPNGVGSPSTVKEHADEVNKYGVFVKADHNISVFAVIRAGAGMDASNILPTTALGTEYILQDYIPHAKSGDAPYTTMATILATEDNTEITVKPKGTLLQASTPKLVNNKITLNKGETYYLMAENNGSNNNCLSGTEVTANKNIAVFQGVPCTFIPHDIGNRDALYEQAMPVMYWGTEFVATRSFAKGANFIRITASESGSKTTVFVNGNPVSKKLERGETYEIELVSNSEDRMSDTDDHKHNLIDTVIIGKYIHIKTSCPSAVYSYDCGASYKDNDKPELAPNTSHTGDPSSVWIAPMEQSIDQITFGACGTNDKGGNQTVFHYLDVVVETASIKETTLYSYHKSEIMDISNEFEKVEGTIYSYARVYLDSADNTVNSAFTIANPHGLVAHVYGNGKSESYAYSVGSSAVVQGVKLDGKKYIDGTHIEDKTFCVGTPIEFDTKVGNDVIERVTWDLGDGTSQETEETKISYIYTTPGWYDLTVTLWGHQVCDDASGTVNLGSATVSFSVIEPEFKFGKVEHLCLDTGTAVIPANELDTLWPEDGKCEPIIYVNYIHYGKETVWYDTIPNAKDSYYEPLNGKTYPLDPTKPEDYIVDIELNVSELTGKKNQYQCDSLIMRHVEISTCLHMTMDNTSDQHSCYGEKMDVPYTHVRGKIGDATMQFIGELAPSTPQPIVLEDGIATLPTQDLKPGEYTAKVEVKDGGCDETLTFTIPFTVYYPSDIFVYMFDNTLAVYKAGNGGNKKLQQDFTGYTYQWYLKGEPIPGANSSVYVKQDGKFAEGDSVFVEFIDPAGYKLKSCAQILPERDFTAPEEEDDTNNAPALKLLINNRLVIRKDGQTYNMYGQRVE